VWEAHSGLDIGSLTDGPSLSAITGGLGCCPTGHTCSGGQTLTTTVYVPVPVAPTTTWYPPAVVTSYYVAPLPAPAPPTSTVYAPVVVIASATTAAPAAWQPATSTVWQPQPVAYCSTLTARGDDLPQARPGWCGTLLVVNAGRAQRARRAWWYLSWRELVMAVPVVVVGLWRWVGD